MMTVVRVPALFYWDHVSRDLAGGTVLRESSRFVTVELSDAELSELLSDAEHYAHMGAGGSGFGREYRGLVSSAAATVRALRAVSDGGAA